MSPDEVRGSPKVRRRRPAHSIGRSGPSARGTMTLWLIGLMGVAAMVCLLVGWRHQGAEWMSLLEAAGLMVLGLAAVATGLLEWEWLERVVNLVIDIWTGWIPWWWGRSSSLSESDTLGRRGATVIWVGIGVALFAWGCWVAL